MEVANRYEIPVVENAAEGFGSKFDGKMLGTFGKFGVLSFNGNKLITTSGGGALICGDDESRNNIMWYATQAHIDHHKHVQALYEELFADVPGVEVHRQPADARYDSNFWLCCITLDPALRIVGQENAYKKVITSAVGGAAGVIKSVESAVTDCQPNDNVEALREFMLSKKVESRPVWKPMHMQPVYAGCPAYVNGVSEAIFKVGVCLPAGPCVSDEDVRYIVECIKEAIVK